MARNEQSWQADEIAEQYRTASAVMRELQQILAETPGEEVSTKHLAEALGTTRQGLAGAVGAYSAYVNRHWGRYLWPFTVRRAQSAHQTYYRMPPEVAEIIRSQPRG